MPEIDSNNSSSCSRGARSKHLTTPKISLLLMGRPGWKELLRCSKSDISWLPAQSWFPSLLSSTCTARARQPPVSLVVSGVPDPGFPTSWRCRSGSEYRGGSREHAEGAKSPFSWHSPLLFHLHCLDLGFSDLSLCDNPRILPLCQSPHIQFISPSTSS